MFLNLIALAVTFYVLTGLPMAICLTAGRMNLRRSWDPIAALGDFINALRLITSHYVLCAVAGYVVYFFGSTALIAAGLEKFDTPVALLGLFFPGIVLPVILRKQFKEISRPSSAVTHEALDDALDLDDPMDGVHIR